MPPVDNFLSRMDAASNPPAPVEPEKKKMSKGMLIGIIVGVVAVVGIVATFIILSTSGKPKATPTVTTSYSPEPEIDPEVEERNALRADDLKVLGEAVKKYQAVEESEGQLPGSDLSEWDNLIAYYTPDGVVKDGATGEPYVMGAVCKFGQDCVDISALTWEENAHQIYVLYNADCKGTTKENVIVSSTRLRRAAIFAIVEGEQFICATN